MFSTPRTPLQGDPVTDGHGPDDHEEHDLGLAHDLPTLLNRRRLLGFLGGAGAVAALAACGSSDETSASPSTATTTTGGTAANTSDTTAATDSEIPEETAGPFPGDGS